MIFIVNRGELQTTIKSTKHQLIQTHQTWEVTLDLMNDDQTWLILTLYNVFFMYFYKMIKITRKCFRKVNEFIPVSHSPDAPVELLWQRYSSVFWAGNTQCCHVLTLQNISTYLWVNIIGHVLYKCVWSAPFINNAVNYFLAIYSINLKFSFNFLQSLVTVWHYLSHWVCAVAVLIVAGWPSSQWVAHFALRRLIHPHQLQWEWWTFL